MAATAGLAGSGLAVAAPSASAAPLPAAYSATATGDVLTAASSIVGANLLATDLVHSTSAVDSTDATAPSTATSANLGVLLGPVGVRAANTETAPPDSADSGGLASVTLPGVLSTGVLTYTDEATWAGANACVPAGQPISRAVTTTTGASVGALGVNVLQTGVSSVTTTTSLTAQSPTHDTRGVTSTARGNVAGLALLGGAVRVSALQPELSTTATSGAAGSASITGSSVQVTGPGIGTVTLVAGADLTVSVPLVGSVTLHLASNADIVAAGGTFSTTYLTARVSLLAGTGTVTLGILPLTVAATAPAGGVECDTTAPAINIVAPADGSTVPDATPTFSGTSGVLSGSITLAIDGGSPVTVPTAADGSWSYTPTTPLSETTHTAVATATDTAGNSATDSTRFTVDVPPAVAITEPADGSATNDATPAITGTSNVLSGSVRLAIDGGAPATVPTAADGSWSYTPATALGEGPHVAVATATDPQGNTATDSSTFTVDTTAPAVTITAPADGSVTNDPTPAITGTSDVLNGSISLTIDAGTPVSVPTGADGSWTYTPTTDLADGSHTAVARATDAAGNTASDSSTFTIDTTAPAVAITAPADGSSTNDATPALTGTSDVLNGSISLTIDAGTPVSVPTGADGSWTYTPTTDLADGSHTAVARATDAAGNTASDSSTFTIDTTAPAVAITAPADGSSTNDATPPITGTSDVLNGSISLAIDAGTPVSVPTGADGSWTYTPTTDLADGSHTAVARATDAAG
ncbi:Ig-like domain-containing protein, partial [Knoellia koreensis]